MAPADDHPTDARTTPALAPGTVVGGRFEIREQLGTGGMGLVYRAFDRSLDQLVALKMLHADLEADPALIASFRDEVKLARLITHPAVCRLHDLEQADGHHFLTMELLEGETLAARLAREPRLPAAEVARIGRGIVAGLGAAHAVGVLHLDLKPGNVMLERGGRIVVMDFGLSRALAPAGETPGSGVVAGTVAYMAPEQLAGGALDPRVDIYSLGLVMYEMACGVVPGTGPTVAATAQARLDGEPPDPRARRPDLPERLRRTIRTCLAPRPADRYASVDEVWHELEAAGPPTWLGDVSGHFTRPQLPAQPRPKRRALVGAVALALAAVAALLWLQRPRVHEVPRIAVVLEEQPAAATPAEARLRRAAQRLVARELVERGLVAAAEARPGPGAAAVQVRLTHAPGAFTIEAQLPEGRRQAPATPTPTIAAAAAQAATAVAAVLRTPPPARDARALEATGAASAEADREVELAQAAVFRQDREGARHHAARALALEPGLVAPHLARAGVEEACTDASRGHLRRAREAARGRTDLSSRLAEAWARYEVDADDAGGLAAFAALYAAHPGHPDVAYQYANALGDMWQVEKANAVLERLLETRSAHVPAMMRLFDLRINNAEVQQLLRDGARLIEQAPEEPQAYVILGRTLLAAGRFDDALAAFGEALVIDPSHDLALIFAGRTKFYQGDVDGARVMARRLLSPGAGHDRPAPSGGDARRRAAGLRNLGLADLLDGRFADGLRQLEESLRTSPDDANDGNFIHKVLVYTHKDLGDFEAALAAAGRWRQHAAKATFWAQIAYARQEEDAFRLRLGRITPAQFRAELPVYLADLKKVAGPDVIAGQGPKLIMWHAFALGDYREALLAALKDESPSCYNQFLIAESYAQLGEHEKAVEWYRRLLTKPDEEIIPTLVVRTRLRLGDALTALGRHEEARAAYAKFLAAWGNADRRLPEVERARQRLGAAP
jgi:tetratricopeptide (TPR) repeat protein